MSRRTWIVTYDIRDNRRLGRICRFLKGEGVHLQYSVFVVRRDRRALDSLVERLGQMIDPGRDDVRIYPVPEDPGWTAIGRKPLPEAVQLLEAGGLLPREG